MKIIHIMHREKFTKLIVGFYNQYYNNGQHEILYLNNVGNESLINKDFSIRQNELFLSKNRMKNANIIVDYLKKSNAEYFIIHSLLFDLVVQLFLVTIYPFIFKKIIWIEWGADLYSWRMKKKNLKNIVKNYIGYRFRAKIKNFIAIFPADIEKYKSDFPKSKAKIFYAPYIGYPNSYVEYCKKCPLEEARKKKEEIVIQIGHNGMETLNHIEVLQNLSKYKDENIKIFMPLSYGGTVEYIDKVIAYANELFSGKTLILRDFMPLDQYNEITKSVSIAIFHTDRQCALGNIHNFNMKNVKVFLDEKGAMYNYFADNAIPIAKYEDIESMTFEQFVQSVKTDNMELFEEYVNEIQTAKKAKEMWYNIYRDLGSDI